VSLILVGGGQYVSAISIRSRSHFAKVLQDAGAHQKKRDGGLSRHQRHMAQLPYGSQRQTVHELWRDGAPICKASRDEHWWMPQKKMNMTRLRAAMTTTNRRHSGTTRNHTVDDSFRIAEELLTVVCFRAACRQPVEEIRLLENPIPAGSASLPMTVPVAHHEDDQKGLPKMRMLFLQTIRPVGSCGKVANKVNSYAFQSSMAPRMSDNGHTVPALAAAPSCLNGAKYMNNRAFKEITYLLTMHAW
jgi:hypothetical protein